MKISYSCLIVVVVIGLGTVTAAPADVKAVAADAAKFTFMGHEYDTKLARLAREAAVDIRLAGVGANETAGRVEVNYLGSWGTICDDHWGMEDVRVVCRQLDLGEPVAFTKKAHFGQGTGNVLLDNVACTGYEENIAQCHHRGFNVSNCNHDEDAGVICSGPTTTTTTKTTATTALKTVSTATTALKKASTATTALKTMSTAMAAIKKTSTAMAALKTTSTATTALKTTTSTAVAWRIVEELKEAEEAVEDKAVKEIEKAVEEEVEEAVE